MLKNSQFKFSVICNIFFFSRPLNFLVDPVYRFPYIMIFGVLAIDLITFIEETGTSPSEIANNIYLDILYKICKRISEYVNRIINMYLYLQ